MRPAESATLANSLHKLFWFLILTNFFKNICKHLLCKRLKFEHVALPQNEEKTNNVYFCKILGSKHFWSCILLVKQRLENLDELLCNNWNATTNINWTHIFAVHKPCYLVISDGLFLLLVLSPFRKHEESHWEIRWLHGTPKKNLGHNYFSIIQGLVINWSRDL